VRIAIVVCAYPPFMGGIGNAAARHAHTLVELGHDVEVLSPAHRTAPGTSVVDGVTVHRLRPVVSHGLSAFLPGLARRVRDYDGLLVQYPFFGGAEPAALGARLSRTPYLVYFHMDVIWGGARGVFLRVHRRLGAPWVLRGARQVLVSSFDYAQHSSIAHLKLSNLRELPYSVDTNAFTPAPVTAERRRELGIDPVRPVVLFVGTMSDAGTFKGIDRLLAAVAHGGLSAHAQVVLAGDGNRRPEYMRMAAELLPEGSYRFTGGVSDEELRDLYRAAAVTVLPSVTHEEAFGIVLIESMACGTPVVASALPGVRGVIGDEAGLAVPPGDVPRLARAIGDVLDDVAGSDHLAVVSRSRAVTVFSRERERADLAAAVDTLGR
jgi:glycosyltransferase involved in cell wall biosynthesis